MKQSDLGEFGWIDRVAPGCIVRPAAVVCGIGDDCAVTRGEAGRLRLLTTDLLVERTHFLRETITPFQLGAKALAVNLSDVAAMGGVAEDAFISIAVPAELSVEYLDDLYRGLKAMAGRFGVNILGGDTTRSHGDLVLNVVVTGEADEGRVLYRSGARPGDVLYVTGFLGDSAAGLDALTTGRAQESAAARELARRHLEPMPHLREGQAIAASGLAHAMIDVSDGLAADLQHLCARSGVGVEVDEAVLPVSAELAGYCAGDEQRARALALSGGEDYVLLLAGDPRLREVLAAEGIPLHPVGRVLATPERVVRRPDGSRDPLVSGGWDHFSR